jgi:hypothetical protein
MGSVLKKPLWTQAAFASMISFTVGGIIPLLGGVFIGDPRIRLVVVAVSILQLLLSARPCGTVCVTLEDSVRPVCILIRSKD